MSLLTPFVALEQVTLLDCSCSSSLDPLALPEEPPELQIEHQCSGEFRPAPGRVVVCAQARFYGSVGGAKVLEIGARYQISYLLPAGFTPSQQDVDAFAQSKGIFNAWPYLRELLSSMSARMGLPLPALPLLRVAGARAGEGE